jgi:hypothetical protein
VLDETERYLGHLASVAITTFVDALAQPAAVLAVMRAQRRCGSGGSFCATSLCTDRRRR